VAQAVSGSDALLRIKCQHGVQAFKTVLANFGRTLEHGLQVAERILLLLSG
jgi:hypothetical protein